MRDPRTGAEFLALSGALFEQHFCNELASGAANTAYTLFSERADAAQAARLADNAMSATSRLVDSFFERAEGAVACRSGCDHCCHQSVGVTPPEALRILAFLQESRSSEQLAELRTELSERRKATQALTANERFSPDHPCPFLGDGKCSIYAVRPLSCRGMNSLDARDCERRLRDPEARQAFLQQGFGGRVLLEPVRAVEAVSAGMQMALSEHFFVDMRPLDLIAAMDSLLSRGSTVAEEWLAGDDGFQPALGGEATRRVGAGSDVPEAMPEPSRAAGGSEPKG